MKRIVGLLGMAALAVAVLESGAIAAGDDGTDACYIFECLPEDKGPLDTIVIHGEPIYEQDPDPSFEVPATDTKGSEPGDRPEGKTPPAKPEEQPDAVCDALARYPFPDGASSTENLLLMLDLLEETTSMYALTYWLGAVSGLRQEESWDYVPTHEAAGNFNYGATGFLVFRRLLDDAHLSWVSDSAIKYWLRIGSAVYQVGGLNPGASSLGEDPIDLPVLEDGYLAGEMVHQAGADARATLEQCRSGKE